MVNTFSMQQYANERVRNSRKQADAHRMAREAKTARTEGDSRKGRVFSGLYARLAIALKRLNLRRAFGQGSV